MTETGWTVRGWRDGDEERLRRVGEIAFGQTLTDQEWQNELSTLERDRILLVTDPSGADPARADPGDAGPGDAGPGDAGPGDDGELVGVAGAFTFELSVPQGRSVPAAGVSWVSVSPTHRRLGVLRALMDRQLTDIAVGGEPVAFLWCSEATIYGRFGYGMASSDMRVIVDRHRSAIDPVLLAGTDRLRPEFCDPLESLPEVEGLYEVVRRSRPGMPRRSAAWQHLAIADDEAARGGAGALRVVAFRDGAGTVRAAARFRVESWSQGAPGRPRRILVQELYADSPRAGAAAWSWLGELDLVGGYRAGTRPVDDPLLSQLTDLRAASVEPGDALWVRLVDLPAAVAARGYAADTDVVVELTDAGLPANAGRWRLRTAAGEGTATRSDDEPDLTLDIAILSGAYLGAQGSLVRARHAGRIDERTPGATLRLSRAFESELQPWCPVHF